MEEQQMLIELLLNNLKRTGTSTLDVTTMVDDQNWVIKIHRVTIEEAN